jgi:hypothetical protein
MHELRERGVDGDGPRAVEQTFRHGQRRGRQIQHQLPVLADAGVVVPRTGRHEPGRAGVDLLRDAVHCHYHRAVEPEHDLMKVVHVRRFYCAEAAECNARGGNDGMAHRLDPATLLEDRTASKQRKP